jgi:hypothetical protein
MNDGQLSINSSEGESTHSLRVEMATCDGQLSINSSKDGFLHDLRVEMGTMMVSLI